MLVILSMSRSYVDFMPLLLFRAIMGNMAQFIAVKA